MERLTEFEGAATPINSVKMVVENEQVIARGNITEVEDAELGGPVRMQQAFGRLSRTPGKVRHAGEPSGKQQPRSSDGASGLHGRKAESRGNRFGVMGG